MYHINSMYWQTSQKPMQWCKQYSPELRHSRLLCLKVSDGQQRPNDCSKVCSNTHLASKKVTMQTAQQTRATQLESNDCHA